DDVAVAAIEIDADSAGLFHGLLVRVWFFQLRIPRQAFLQLLPGRAAVGRLVQAAARTAAAETEDGAAALIRGRDQRARTARVHCDVADASVLVDEEHIRPCLAAVGRFVHAAILRWTPKISFGSDVDAVRIGWIDDDAT